MPDLQPPPAAPDEWADRRVPIVEDMAFQRASWRAERCAWVGMAIVVTAGLAGALGGGSLIGLDVERRAGDLSVGFPAVARIDAPVRYVFGVKGRTPGAPIEIRLGRALGERASIEHVRPTPESYARGDAGEVHRHRIAADGTLLISLDVRPRAMGWLSFEVATPEGGRVTVGQIVLP